MMAMPRREVNEATEYGAVRVSMDPRTAYCPPVYAAIWASRSAASGLGISPRRWIETWVRMTVKLVMRSPSTVRVPRVWRS